MWTPEIKELPPPMFMICLTFHYTCKLHIGCTLINQILPKTKNAFCCGEPYDLRCMFDIHDANRKFNLSVGCIVAFSIMKDENILHSWYILIAMKMRLKETNRYAFFHYIDLAIAFGIRSSSICIKIFSIGKVFTWYFAACICFPLGGMVRDALWRVLLSLIFSI